jgi:predicted Zn-dependent peptidase
VPPVKQSPPRKAPPVAPVSSLTFPTLEHATLSNGIEVVLARRTAVPKLLVNVEFDAGVSGDALDAPGTQGMLMAMLDEGTAQDATGGHTRNPTQIREEQERLGADLQAGAAMDTSNVMPRRCRPIWRLRSICWPMVRRPAFDPAELERVKQQRLASLAQTMASPQGLAFHVFNPILFGPNHPYGHAGDGLGTQASIKGFTPEPARRAEPVAAPRSGAHHRGRRHHHGGVEAAVGGGLRHLEGSGHAETGEGH